MRRSCSGHSHPDGNTSTLQIQYTQPLRVIALMKAKHIESIGMETIYINMFQQLNKADKK